MTLRSWPWRMTFMTLENDLQWPWRMTFYDPGEWPSWPWRMTFMTLAPWRSWQGRVWWYLLVGWSDRSTWDTHLFYFYFIILFIIFLVLKIHGASVDGLQGHENLCRVEMRLLLGELGWDVPLQDPYPKHAYEYSFLCSTVMSHQTQRRNETYIKSSA